jgi:nicotinamidase-related amidase
MPAVIVIDLQTALVDGAAAFPPLHGRDRLIENTNRLTDWARSSGQPVLYVRHDGLPHEFLARGAPGWPIHPSVAPQEGEPIFEKTVGDAFAETNLADWLRERGIEDVILLGAATNQCINDTCRGALDRGFQVTVAADAHSTWAYGGETAEQIIAGHNKTFADLGARVETVDKLVG